MSFALLSTAGVLIGLLVLAISLFIAQRLRVQHREVEVLSTLFWQAAIEETRARVFVRQFRHWLAWVLVFAIAALLWILMAQPTPAPLDGTQHVVLLDWSVDGEERREADLQLAIARAATLPSNSLEIVAAGEHLETLLVAGEPVELARLRAADIAEEQPAIANGIDWAIETLSFRARTDQPLAIHLVGNTELEQSSLRQLRPDVTVYRIERDPVAAGIQLKTLGAADSASGRWSTVDVAIGVDVESEFDAATLVVKVDDQVLEQPLQSVSKTEFQMLDVVAGGGTLSVQVEDQLLGSLTLPKREPIRVLIEEGVPATLRELMEIDSACQIVESNPDLKIGFGPDSDLRLSSDEEPAFSIESDDADPNAALDELIDTLALQQIDAMTLAEQAGQVIDVQVVSGDQRRIAIWNRLFTPAFDFSESRACPILVAKSIRWLADRPPLVPWVQLGEKLPEAAPEFDRATASIALASDGREFVTTRLFESVRQPADLDASPPASLFARVGLFTWFGLILSTLLAGEWMLYQRGRMP